MTSRLLVVFGTLLAAAVSLTLGGEPRGPILRATAGGALQIENSRDGLAVLTASRLRPGDSAEGTLTLKNLAPGFQQLSLETTDVRDTAGRGGGLLSEWVDLRIERAGDPVYVGKLADLTTLDLGNLGAGTTTPFRFVVTLPEQGPAVDDAYAGGSVEVGWKWVGLTDVGQPPADPPKPPKPPKPKPPVAAPPEVVPPGPGRRDVEPSDAVPAPPVPIDELEGPAAPRAPRTRLWIGGRSTQRLGRAFELATVCRPDCTLRVAAKVQVGGRWRTLGRRALGRVASESQPSSLRFPLSAPQQRSLRATLRRHGALTVRISVTASAAGHAPVTKVRTLRLRP